MAKRRRSTAPKRRKRKSGTSLMRRSVGVAKRRRSSRRGLSAGIPFIGEMSVHNPLIGGAVGGISAWYLLDEIEDDIFGNSSDPESWQTKIKPWAKGIVLTGVGFLARRMKQPEISAGIMGVAAMKTMEKLKEVGKLSSGGGRSFARYANPDLLSDPDLLNDPSLLSYRKGRRGY